MKAFVSISALAKKLGIALAFGLPTLGLAQLGVGTTTPHPSSMMHIVAGPGNNKGLILPSISSGSRVVLDSTQNMAHGLIFFDNELQKFYYFHQNPKEWYEMDHDWVRKDVAGASPVVGTHIYSGVPGNVGIGTASTVNPAAKLTVVGNQSIGSATFTQDSVPPANSLIVQTWVGIGTRTRVSGRRLDVKGNVGVTGTVTASQFIGEGIVPPGTVVMWSGAINTSTNFDANGRGVIGTVYEGWQMCNGYSSAPDLRGRFIVGAIDAGTQTQQSSSGGGYTNTEYNEPDYATIGNRGGIKDVTLTINEMPSHDHTITDPGHDHQLHVDGNSTVSAADCGKAIADVSTVPCAPFGFLREQSTAEILLATTGITSTNNRGSGNSFDNRPKYYVLAYIIKL